MKPLVAIVGATATGKSDLAIQLAREFSGEVIGADSRQIYRGMDIGTAKILPEEMGEVPHRLIDIRDPDDEFSLADYREAAEAAITEVYDRGNIPILAGGTGQYVWAILEGWEMPRVEPDQEFRKQMEEKSAAGGGEELYRELREVDPEAAESIDPKNIRRVIRALEVVKQTGKPFSGQRIRKEPSYDSLIIGLTLERKELYRRIDLRVDRMIEQDFINEVKQLLANGYSDDLPSMSSIGYKQILSYLQGDISLEEAVRRIKTETHRLVRRQYNWFSLKDERIHWLDISGDYTDQARELMKAFLSAPSE